METLGRWESQMSGHSECLASALGLLGLIIAFASSQSSIGNVSDMLCQNGAYVRPRDWLGSGLERISTSVGWSASRFI